MMTPKSEAELAEIVVAAKGPLSIAGGGTGGLPAACGEAVSTAGLSGISLYEPGALTVVAGAGTPLSELEAALAAEGQHLPFEPADLRGVLGTTGEPTIGGIVAANASGPRRIQAGACRDSLIGVRFVDGTGAIVKNGGRVMKNVTGYDLVKLLAGSYGTLGVLTEVSLKLLPAPSARATVMIDGLDIATAQTAMAAGLGSAFDVTGAAHVPVGLDGDPVTMLRLEGLPDSIAYRAEKLGKIAEAFGPVRVEMDADAVKAGWAWVGGLEGWADQSGDIWRISVRPSHAAEIAAIAGGEAVFDWGGGLVSVLQPEGTDLRTRLGAFEGHATLLRGSEDTRARLGTFHPEPAPLAAIAAGLRSKFDPRCILNPGLMA